MRFPAVLILLVIFLGCSKANENAPNINPVTGKHPSGWAVATTGGLHSSAYISGPSACFECHGKNMNGGISGVSCFSSSYNGINCHSAGPSGHPQGWSAPTAHGASAKAASQGRDGFLHCTACHGSDYRGGIVNKSCFNSAGCHLNSPHSATPWRSTVGGYTHSSSDASNAVACGSCHSAGANSSRQPSVTPPPGTAVGCFNNTLCHGVEGHQTGWSSPSVHGTAAIALSSGDEGFKACTYCHGTGFDGGSAEQSCLSSSGCHTVAAPHPAKPWRSTTGLSHTRCDTSNAAQCALCHTGGSNSDTKPGAGALIGLTGCFNNTLCHGEQGHAAGWNSPSIHGAEAKKAPTPSTGFSSCQLCHGAAFINGAAVTCFKGIGCHGFGVNSPHSPKPWFSRTGGPTHNTTDTANVGTCAICHTAGANSTIKPPFPASNTLANCFNNTLCHFHQIPYAPSATISPTLHGGEAKKDLTICQTCHGTKGTTSFDGITLADGSRTIACSSCHTRAKAHPTDWQGEGTYSHRTAGNKSVACAVCHAVSQGATALLPAAPSCYSTTFTNSLGQSRTCHANGPGVAPHTVPYNNHNATARNNSTYCLGCHQIADNRPVTSPTPPGCMNCHLQSPVTNPNNCVSCHSKPPNGSAYPNIGYSHASHNVMNVSDICAECHSGLGLGTVDHLDRARLRSASVQANPVRFGTLATTGGLTPAYSALSGCINTYCHGASLFGGTNKAPLWGQSNYLTASGCGTCHGFPPANSVHNGISSATPCSSCHTHVKSTNDGFTDPTKHINGVLDVTESGHAFPYSGALHLSLGATRTNCSGCHNTTSTGGTYPVAAGVKPLCSACHLNMTRFSGTTPGCWDCHGASATDGRPNGTTFPNRRGGSDGHSRGTHTVTCTICHPITTGSTSHGWSNRVKSSNALINATMNWNPGTRASGQGSCNPAAGGLTGCHSSKTGWY